MVEKDEEGHQAFPLNSFQEELETEQAFLSPTALLHIPWMVSFGNAFT